MIDLLVTGLQLSVFGMGLVFLLLALLAGLVRLMLHFDNGVADVPVPAEAVDAAAALDDGTPPALTSDQLAAISIAVLMHRTVRRKQAAPMMRHHWPGTLPSRWVTAGRTRQNRIWEPVKR